MEKQSKGLLMLLKEDEITIVSGFMDVVLLVEEMAANLLEMVVQVVCIFHKHTVEEKKMHTKFDHDGYE